MELLHSLTRAEPSGCLNALHSFPMETFFISGSPKSTNSSTIWFLNSGWGRVMQMPILHFKKRSVTSAAAVTHLVSLLVQLLRYVQELWSEGPLKERQEERGQSVWMKVCEVIILSISEQCTESQPGIYHGETKSCSCCTLEQPTK